MFLNILEGWSLDLYTLWLSPSELIALQRLLAWYHVWQRFKTFF